MADRVAGLTPYEQRVAESGIRHLRYIVNENVCVDCMNGDHEVCRHEGGYLDDEDNDQRCGCHLTAHALDNRKAV